MNSKTVIDISVHADVKHVSGEQYGHTAEVPRFAQYPSYFSMRRRQLMYERGCSLDVAEEIIRRETTKDGSAAHRDGHIAEASDLTRSVPPTGMRLIKILGGLRVHLRSVGRQIGPDSLLAFVEKVIRQDFQDQANIERQFFAMPTTDEVVGVTREGQTMTNDILSLLRGELATAAENLKQCNSLFKGLKAFKGNQPGLAFCAEQLLPTALALREHTEQIVALAENLHDVYSDVPEQLALDDIAMDSRA